VTVDWMNATMVKLVDAWIEQLFQSGGLDGWIAMMGRFNANGD